MLDGAGLQPLISVCADSWGSACAVAQSSTPGWYGVAPSALEPPTSTVVVARAEQKQAARLLLRFVVNVGRIEAKTEGVRRQRLGVLDGARIHLEELRPCCRCGDRQQSSPFADRVALGEHQHRV